MWIFRNADFVWQSDYRKNGLNESERSYEDVSDCDSVINGKDEQ